MSLTTILLYVIDSRECQQAGIEQEPIFMKKRWIVISIVVLITVGVCSLWYFLEKNRPTSRLPIRIGILHSLTGTMAFSEKAVADATLLAIEELNESGGVLGRKIEALLVDGKSDWPTFAKEAEKLITVEQVSVIFGCWTSASRKTVKPVFEKHNQLLFYPVQYEGLEESPNIIYTGAAPNQQIIPAVVWCFENLGKRFFLIGSDYIFPRVANEIIRDHATAIGAEIVGEEYLLLGSRDVDDIIRKIKETKPDVILNTVNGDSNVPFFEGLQAAGITADVMPVMSFSIAENELLALGPENMVGNYACWNYFQSIDNSENSHFINTFKKKYGADRVVDDPMEAAYISVHLWAQTVGEIGTVDVIDVRRALGNQSFDAPEGLVYVDPTNLHIWKTVRIGRIRSNGQFEIVWDSNKPVQPLPYPRTRSKSEWNRFLQDLYESWGQTWENPGK